MKVITMESTEVAVFLLNWRQNARKASEQRLVCIGLYFTALNLPSSHCTKLLHSLLYYMLVWMDRMGNTPLCLVCSRAQAGSEVPPRVDECFLSGEVIQVLSIYLPSHFQVNYRFLLSERFLLVHHI